MNLKVKNSCNVRGDVVKLALDFLICIKYNLFKSKAENKLSLGRLRSYSPYVQTEGGDVMALCIAIAAFATLLLVAITCLYKLATKILHHKTK